MTTERAASVAPAQDSASVLLLREGPAGIETLMLQRQASMNFAGGDWAFPGGASEPADRSARILQCIAKPSADTLAALRTAHAAVELEEDLALGLLVAACRETFEESGVLLARHRAGHRCPGSLLVQLQQARLASQSDPEWFVAMLERHDLLLELDQLVYWSNWITPSLSPRRFDARFFIARMPQGQQVDPHLGESQQARWVTLDSTERPPALTPPVTAPPTEYALLELAQHYQRLGSVEALLDHAGRLPVAPLMVKIWRQADAMTGLLPWDADYGAAPGEGVSCDARLRERYGHFPSRRRIDPGMRLPRPKSG